MNNIIIESGIAQTPVNMKVMRGGDKIRFEAVLQDVDIRNRNGRIYRKRPLQEAIETESERIKEGSFLGELDHPIEKDNPLRQCTVLYKEASHKFCELGWDGNKLVGVLETLSGTQNGRTLCGLAKDDKVPICFSFRGMGEINEIHENGVKCNEVSGPMKIITWDSVSFPSHSVAKIIRINENVQSQMNEKFSVVLEESAIEEKNGMICLENGMCYFPNVFDKMVEERIITLKKKFELSEMKKWR